MSLLSGIWPIQSRSQSPLRRTSVWRHSRGECVLSRGRRAARGADRGDGTHKRPIVPDGSFLLRGYQLAVSSWAGSFPYQGRPDELWKTVNLLKLVLMAVRTWVNRGNPVVRWRLWRVACREVEGHWLVYRQPGERQPMAGTPEVNK
jgi:hypothetical protein